MTKLRLETLTQIFADRGDSQTPWHHWQMNRVFAQLDSSPAGLSYSAARKRLRNRSRRSRNVSRIWTISPLSYGLVLLAMAVNYGAGASAVAIAIVLVGIFHAGVGAIADFRISKLGAKSSPLAAVAARVKRDGTWLEIAARDLVLGDVVILQAGDRPEVNVRLFETTADLIVNQSQIGGTVRSLKQATANLPLDTPTLSQTNMIQAGTVINSGVGMGIVVSFGTPIKLVQGQALNSALTNQLNGLRQVWVIAIAGLAIGLLIWSLVSGQGWTLAVAITLAVYPQNWLRLATLSQLLGLRALERQKIEVKSPAAISWLSQISILCLVITGDSEFSFSQPDSVGLTLHGILKDANPKQAEAYARANIPIFSYVDAPVERIRLWQLQGHTVAVVAQDAEDVALFHQADLAICDRHSPLALLESADLILPASPNPNNNFDLVPPTLLAARTVWESMAQVVWLGWVSSITVLSLALMARFTALQTLWIGAIALPTLTYALWLEPSSAKLMQLPVAHYRHLIPSDRYFNLGISILAIAAPVITVFQLKYLGDPSAITEARSMAMITLVTGVTFYTLSLKRSPFWRNLSLWAAIALVLGMLVAIVQLPWLAVQFGIMPIKGIQWLIAILAGTCAFWLRQLFPMYR